MSLERFKMIDTWAESDLLQLSGGETDEYEFKSSRIHTNDLIKEIQVAASAFWNSGGGILIVGLDDTGKIDGGISDMMGRQRLRDWVDRVISHVEPAGPYTVRLIYGEGNGKSAILPDHCVLVIAYGESNAAPHMAPDKRYYVRAGTHSDPAGHFLVEAIRARRRLQKPVLRGLLRTNRHNINMVELVVLALNETPALDVRLNFTDLPPDIQGHFDGRLPLYIPVIDQMHPFEMDASWFGLNENEFGKLPIHLHMTYHDLAGRSYDNQQTLDPTHNLAPIGERDNGIATHKTLHDISTQIQHLRHTVEQSNGDEDK